MNSNENINSSNNTSSSNEQKMPAATRHISTIETALKIVETQMDLLSIVEAEKIMKHLDDLQMCINDMVVSRIPSDRLSMVEGKWYITVTAASNDKADILAKYKTVLAASPLSALEGYAAQMLAETQIEERRLSTLAADPDKDFADYFAQELAPVTARRESLEAALKEIRRIMNANCGEAIAEVVGLDSAVIESLVASEWRE